VFEVELPFDLAARFDGLYSRTRYAIDRMAFDHWLEPGPSIQRDSLIESRFSVGRELWTGVQLELAWATQTPFSFSSTPAPDRQTVGAFIRFSH
jgi:hypothetical protein